MKKNTVVALVSALSVLLVGAVIWGVSGQIARQRYRMRLESMYQRSFYELVGGMDNLEVKLSKLMVSDAPEQEAILLSDVYRQTDSTGRELSALPASHQSIAQVMSFVNQLGDYSRYLAQNVSEGRPVSLQEQKQLEALLARCIELNQLVQGLDAQALTKEADHLPEPMGEDDPFAASNQPSVEVPALIYDGPFSDAAQGPPKALGEEMVTQEMAREIARDFVGAERVQQVLDGQGIEGDIPTFGVEVDTSDAGRLFLQITRQGGQVLMMMPERSPRENNYTVEQCRQSAEGFLEQKGYGDMEAGYWQNYNGLVTFNFVSVMDGVRLYPDLVKVQVSMQTGTVIGLEAGNYLRNHVARTLPEVQVTREQALEKADRLQVESLRLCVVPLLDQERYCYEIRGKFSDDLYLLYVNAENGRVENILKVLLEDDGEQVI